MSETAEIRDWLAARQSASEESFPAQSFEVPSKTLQSNSGIKPPARPLDESHKALLRELLQRPSWRLRELRAITARVGLMPLACVAALNEWAADRYGDPILEGEEIIHVNNDLKEKLKL